MKYKALSLAVAVSILPAINQSQATDQNVALVGSGTVYTLAWEHVPEPIIPEARFAIYTNGVLAQILTTNNFTIVTNVSGTNTYTARFVAPSITSKDVITLTALNELNQESDQGNALMLYTLGKPKRPEGLRKQ